MLWSVIFIVIIIALFWLKWRYNNKRLIEMAKQFPGPPELPLLGNAVSFMCSPERLITVLKHLISDYGEVFRVWLGPDLNVVVTNPDDFRSLLTTNKVSFKGPQYKYMADILGGGILSGSGPVWRKHRKIATPNYGKRAVENYSNIFNEEVDVLLKKLREMLSEQQFNIYDHVVQSTSYVVCQSLMGLTKEQTMNLPHLQEIIELNVRLYDIVFARMTRWYLQIDPIFWMTSFYKEQKYFTKIMNRFSDTIIKHTNDKLSTLEEQLKEDLVNTEDDDKINTKLSVIDRFILSREFNNDELTRETFTIFTSAQEAAAKITSFLLLMMAYYPKCQKKLYEEIRTVIGDENRWVSNEDLKNMPYLELVFKEVIRLYPIGALIQRSIHEDVTISSGTLPAGCSLLVPIYHIHRDPRFWTNPEEFDPERFNPHNTKQRHPNCYIPFSLGPMDCLGRYFGTNLVKTICVRVLREFEITSLESYKDLRLHIAISATSINGYKVMLRPR